LPDDLTPEQRRLRTLAVLVGQLLVLARRNLVLLEVEDAHWIDPTTLELLEQTLEAIADARVLMLVTARPSFEPGLSSHPHLTRLALDRLGREAGMAIIARLAEGRSVPEEVAAELIARTDGVPLFLEELTRTVLQSGSLRRTDVAYLLDEPLPSLAIPATLHDSLMARLDQLSSGKEVAQIAACIGREFTLDLLAAVTPLSRPELDVALSQLVDAGIVFRRGSRLRPSYIFKHALLRDAAYQSLLKSRRTQLHARIAEALQTQPDGPAAEHPELLAWHYTEAGLTGPAIEAWRMPESGASRGSPTARLWHISAARLSSLRACPQAPSATRPRPSSG
jgi:predicted ATPase